MNGRQRIIAASARLFREQGYEATTVRDISAAVGMHSGSPFYYFKTKDEILVAVMEAGLVTANRVLAGLRLGKKTPREAFREMVRAHLKTILVTENDSMVTMLLEWRSLSARDRKHIGMLRDQYERVWIDLIHALKESGEWRLGKDEKVSKLLLFGAMNWTVGWYKADKGAGTARIADRICDLFVERPAR